MVESPSIEREKGGRLDERGEGGGERKRIKSNRITASMSSFVFVDRMQICRFSTHSFFFSRINVINLTTTTKTTTKRRPHHHHRIGGSDK